MKRYTSYYMRSEWDGYTVRGHDVMRDDGKGIAVFGGPIGIVTRGDGGWWGSMTIGGSSRSSGYYCPLLRTVPGAPGNPAGIKFFPEPADAGRAVWESYLAMTRGELRGTMEVAAGK